MTLNQVIKRIKGIAEAHNQVRNFYYGAPTDFLTDKTTRYASAFLQDAQGSLELSAKTHVFGFKLFLLDLVHVSENAKENEQDVQSDMLSIMKDLVAEINHSSYSDWKLSFSNAVTLLSEEFDDLVAGAVVDISISTMYDLDVCAVPTDELPLQVNADDMKLVYDEKYIATGSEGNTLSIPSIVGKKILFVTRGASPIYKVSSAPQSTEYVWDNINITLGAATNLNEPFLILYRNY